MIPITNKDTISSSIHLRDKRSPTLSSSTTVPGIILDTTEMKTQSTSEIDSQKSVTTIPKKRSPNLTLQSQSKKQMISTALSETHQSI